MPSSSKEDGKAIGRVADVSLSFLSNEDDYIAATPKEKSRCAKTTAISLVKNRNIASKGGIEHGLRSLLPQQKIRNLLLARNARNLVKGIKFLKHYQYSPKYKGSSNDGGKTGPKRIGVGRKTNEA